MHLFILFWLNKHQLTLNVTFGILQPALKMVKIHFGIKHKERQKPEVMCNESKKSYNNEDMQCNNEPSQVTFKCPACLKLFESEHNLWFHLQAYSGPEVQPNCVGIAQVKCHICKSYESSCVEMLDHVCKA